QSVKAAGGSGLVRSALREQAKRTECLRGLGDLSYLDAAARCPRDPRGDLNRLVPIFGFDDVIAAELLLGFHIRSIGGGYVAIAHADRGRAIGRQQTIHADKMAALPDRS